MRPPRFLLPANTKHQNAPDPVGRSGLPNGLENGFPCVRQPHRHRRTGILSYGQKVRGSRTAYRHIPGHRRATGGVYPDRASSNGQIAEGTTSYRHIPQSDPAHREQAEGHSGQGQQPHSKGPYCDSPQRKDPDG